MKLRAFVPFLVLAAGLVSSLDARAAIGFTATTLNATEGGAVVTLTVTRTAPLTGTASVVWTTANGTAVAGTDFGTLNNLAQKTGTLTWTAGVGGAKTISVVTGMIPIINNPAVEEAKSFVVNLSSPTGGDLTANSQATVTILDTDSVIEFAGNASVSEAGPNTTLQLVRTGNTAVAQSVKFVTTVGTATAADFTAVTAGTVTFAIGQTARTIAVGPTTVAAPSIKITQDAVIEGPEIFTVTLSLPTAGATLGAAKTAAVTIISDDNGVSMGAATRSVVEGSGAQEILVSRSGTGVGLVSVNYAINNGTAQNGTHFTGVNGTLNWANGDLDPKAIPVSILDDGAPNASRTFSVTLSAANGAPLGAPATTTVTITDNDNSVQFSVATYAVTEGVANATLSVTRTGNGADPASVTWTANNGTAIAGQDFGILGNPALPTGTLNWAAGEMVAKTVLIPIINDTAAEGTQTFSVVLSNPVGNNLSLGANNTVNVNLNDNDKGFAFFPNTYTVVEGVANAVITVQRIGPVTTTASATWATASGSAVIGQDYGTLNSGVQKTGTLTWPIGNATNKTILIPIINDQIGGEGDKTFTVTLTPGAGYVVAAPGIATVTIQDNDIPPETNVQFTQPKYIVGESGPTVTLSVSRVDIGGGCARGPVQASYATVAGTALATTDYITKTGVLSWTAGECTTKDITVNIVNNAVAEPLEAFKVVLSAPTPGMGLGTPGEASVLIVDDDEVFPTDGMMDPAIFYVPGEATTGWHVSSDPAPFEGMFALKSDQLDDNESAGIGIVANFAAGNVSFRVKVSSELNFDLLKFYIDDVLQTPTWSGTAITTWQASPTYAIPAGVHNLKWMYVKDASVSVGSDAVYLDGLVTPVFTPVP